MRRESEIKLQGFSILNPEVLKKQSPDEGIWIRQQITINNSETSYKEILETTRKNLYDRFGKDVKVFMISLDNKKLLIMKFKNKNDALAAKLTGLNIFIEKEK